jgi:hypothetical protein
MQRHRVKVALLQCGRALLHCGRSARVGAQAGPASAMLVHVTRTEHRSRTRPAVPVAP